MVEENELKQEIIEDLLVLIPNAVKKIKIPDDKKVCFVAIYRSDYDPLVGLIQIGFEDVREANFEEGGIHMAWSSGEQPYKYQNDLEVTHLKEKEKRLINMYDPNEYYGEWWKQCIDVMNKVSMKLNEYEWKEIFNNITDDFVVYIDSENMNVENGDLEKCIPTDKLLKLREKGIYF
ncbi:hypothetical protein M6D81_31490, partial [Paenibacillus sp. J5C_2022]|uniref:hypothetical protein n=1 Tax=Paenibacillus sp. J5C2022 TaxID=2977129 RepID=UPI0021CF1C66